MGCPPASAVPAGARGPATITVTSSHMPSRGWQRVLSSPTGGSAVEQGVGLGTDASVAKSIDKVLCPMSQRWGQGSMPGSPQKVMQGLWVG